MTTPDHAGDRHLGENYHVSKFNFEPDVTSTFDFPRGIELQDTTLRDGEQHATVVFSEDDKLAIAERLDAMGVHRIEAGMPAVSEEDRSAITKIAQRVQNAKVFALVRSRRDDIDHAVACGVDGVQIEMLLNDSLVGDVFGWDRQAALDLMLDSCQYAKSQGLHVASFMIDASRTDLDWIQQYVKAVADAGDVDSFAVVDTAGVCGPEATRWMVEQVRTVWDGSLEIHAHNDLGFGLANTIAALQGGADVAHVSVNGLGERVGNAALEQTAVALRTVYGQDLGLDLSQLRGLSQEVGTRSAVPRAGNQPITGDNIFSMQSGIGIFYFLKLWPIDPRYCYPFLPQLVGHHEPQILLGKLSGAASIEYWAEKLGLEIDTDEIVALLAAVKARSTEEKRLIEPDEIAELHKSLTS